MANLNEILAEAQGGRATALLGREFGLSPDEAQAAVTALLPAISTGLKHATATPDGLANLLALVAEQRDLRAMYDDPSVAFGARGRVAGSDVLSAIFDTPEVGRAVTERAEVQSGIGATTLKDLLPVLAGMLVSGMFGQKSEAAPAGMPSAQQPGSGPGGLWDILEQVFRRSLAGDGGPSQAPTSQLPLPSGTPIPMPGPTPGGGGQAIPGNDLLAAILREMQKAIQDGRLKPIVVQVPLPGGQSWPLPGGQSWPLPSETATSPRDAGPASQPSGTPTPSDEILPGPKMPAGRPQAPGGDIFGNILRELLGGGGRMPQSGFGSALFGDRFEPGQDVDQRQLDEMESLFRRRA